MRKISWFVIKTKFKHIIRSTFYSGFFQWLLCQLITSYLRLVFYTSRKSFINYEVLHQFIKEGKPIISASWHNRIALGYFIFSQTKKINKNYQYHVLASAHGDGMIIGNVMRNLGTGLILGSTRKNNNTRKGIDISNLRKIFKVLKTPNNALCITPDGPRGPRFKVSGQIAAIAKNTQAPIFPTTYAISKRKIFNSWDKFILPLPFSKIIFSIGEPIFVNANSSEEELQKINEKIENNLNELCHKTDTMVGFKLLH